MDRCEYITERKVLECSSCTVCTSQKVATSQMYIRSRMDK